MSFVVLSGASRGIGRATAFALSERAIEVAVLGRPSRALDRTVEEVRAHGARIEAFACDMLDPDQITRACRRVMDQLGTPAALVNNAGVIHRQAVEDTSLEHWDEQIGVNLRAPFLVTREFLPAMRRAGRGRIINVSSIAGTLGTRHAAAYCASKWGLIGFTKALAEELSDSGLMAVSILPGSVETAMLDGSGFEPRMSPEDVARTLVHYALDAPTAHNGGTIEMFGI